MPTPEQIARIYPDVVQPRLDRMPEHIAAFVRGRLDGPPELDWRVRTRVDVDADGFTDPESLRWHIEILTRPATWETIAVATPAGLGLSAEEISAEMLEVARQRAVGDVR